MKKLREFVYQNKLNGQFYSLFFLLIIGTSTIFAENKFQLDQNDVLNQIDFEKGLFSRFSELAFELEVSKDPIAKIQAFLKLYIEQINNQHGISLTIEEFCQIGKQNLFRMNLTPDFYEKAIFIFDLLSFNKEDQNLNEVFFQTESEKNYLKISFPWETNQKKSHQKKSGIPRKMDGVSLSITETPGIFPFAVGLIEGAIGFTPFQSCSWGYFNRRWLH